MYRASEMPASLYKIPSGSGHVGDLYASCKAFFFMLVPRLLMVDVRWHSPPCRLVVHFLPPIVFLPEVCRVQPPPLWPPFLPLHFYSNPISYVILRSSNILFSLHMSTPHIALVFPLFCKSFSWSTVTQHSRCSLPVLPPDVHSTFNAPSSANVDPRYMIVFIVSLGHPISWSL